MNWYFSKVTKKGQQGSFEEVSNMQTLLINGKKETRGTIEAHKYEFIRETDEYFVYLQTDKIVPFVGAIVLRGQINKDGKTMEVRLLQGAQPFGDTIYFDYVDSKTSPEK